MARAASIAVTGSGIFSNAKDMIANKIIIIAIVA